MKNKVLRTIYDVVTEGLCHSCGACVYICKDNAISFTETTGGYLFPSINSKKCSSCGLCYIVCSGKSFGQTIRKNIPNDHFAGNVISCFTGKATNPELFVNSQSGGLASALFLSALETNLIDGALTVSQIEGNPARPSVQLSKNLDDLKNSQKSKYCPVPVLAYLKNLSSKNRFALIGTACQIHGFHNILDQNPDLKNNVVFVVGLICDRVLTHAGIDYLVHAGGATGLSSVFHFRDKTISGYPGNVHIMPNNKKPIVLPAKKRMALKPFLTCARCLICFDKMNVFSDITIGDPHGLTITDRKLGQSVVAVRTEKGKRVLEEALKLKYIDIQKANYKHVLKGQGIEQKKNEWLAYMKAWALLGRPVPDYGFSVTENKISSRRVKNSLKRLKHAFSLDDFTSRDKLIAHTQKSLYRLSIKKAVSLPFRLAYFVYMKLIALITRIN